jgi:hypothetical protein
MTKYTSSCGTLTRTHHIFWAIKWAWKNRNHAKCAFRPQWN